MHSELKKISILIMFPFLLGSTQLELTEQDIKNNRDHYEVIEATTGKKETSQFYAEDAVIATHIETVLAIKKVLAKEGINSSQVRILLYYDPITIRDDSPPRIWNSKSHVNTISSPWLDLTKTITTSGETKITIRIDATSSRLISDLFSQPDNKQNISAFLEIPSLTESCLLWMTNKYIAARFEGGLLSEDLYCASEELKKPLLLLFKSSNSSTGSFIFPVIDELDYYCQDEARKYYSEFYPQLAFQGLHMLEDKSAFDPMWWREVYQKREPIEECK